MPKIIQLAGSSGSNFASQLGQGLLAYQVGLGEYEERKVKSDYYTQLGRKATAEAEKAESEAETLRKRQEARDRIYNKLGVKTAGDPDAPGAMGAHDLGAGGPGGGPSVGVATPSTDWDPSTATNLSRAYYSEENAAFIKAFGGKGAVIPGTFQQPEVMAELAGGEDLRKAYEFADTGYGDKTSQAALDQLEERYSQRLFDAVNKAQSRLYSEKVLDLRSAVAHNAEDRELYNRYEEMLTQMQGEPEEWVKGYQKLEEAESNFFELLHMRGLEDSYVRSAKGWINNAEEWGNIVDQLSASSWVDEDELNEAKALIEGKGKPTDPADHAGYLKYMQDLSAAYDIFSIAKQGKAGSWMSIRSAGMQIESFGNLIQAQNESWTNLREQFAADDPVAIEFIQEAQRLFRDTPPDMLKGLTGRDEVAARTKYVIDTMDAKMLEMGRQGLPDEGYAWVFEQKLPEGVVSGRSPVHETGLSSRRPGESLSDLQQRRDAEISRAEGARAVAEGRVSYDKDSIVIPYEEGSPSRAIDTRVQRAVDRHVQVFGPKDPNYGAGTFSAGMGPDPRRTKALTTERLKSFEKEFKKWWKANSKDLGKRSAKRLGAATNLQLIRMRGMSGDEALHYVMMGMDEMNPDWIYGGGGTLTAGTQALAEDKSRILRPDGALSGWFRDADWAGVVEKSADFAHRGREAAYRQEKMAERGFEPQFEEPGATSAPSREAVDEEVKVEEITAGGRFEPGPRFEEGYDIGSAREAGLMPGPGGHWPSRIPSGKNEGLILKSLDHPTFWMTIEEEKEAGMEWFYNFKELRYYTFPKGTKPKKGFIKRKPKKWEDYETPTPDTDTDDKKKEPPKAGSKTSFIDPFSSHRSSIANTEAKAWMEAKGYQKILDDLWEKSRGGSDEVLAARKAEMGPMAGNAYSYEEMDIASAEYEIFKLEALKEFWAEHPEFAEHEDYDLDALLAQARRNLEMLKDLFSGKISSEEFWRDGKEK